MIKKQLNKMLKRVGNALIGERLENIENNIKSQNQEIMNKIANIIEKTKVDELEKLLRLLHNKIILNDNPLEQLGKMIEETDKFIKRKTVKTILDIGTKDAETAIMFRRYFPNSSIYAFECNPQAIEISRRNIKKSRYNDIFLIEKAISDKIGVLDFYAVDSKKSSNIGASSLFQHSEKNYDKDYNKIKVKSITLKSWIKKEKIKDIDMLWIDIQGAELKALKGLGNEIKKIKFICTEVKYEEMYINQPLFEDIDKYLSSKGFNVQKVLYEACDKTYGVILYLNSALLIDN